MLNQKAYKYKSFTIELVDVEQKIYSVKNESINVFEHKQTWQVAEAFIDGFVDGQTMVKKID